MDVTDAEDAVADAYLTAISDSAFKDAWRRDGERGLLSMLAVTAWRRLRMKSRSGKTSQRLAATAEPTTVMSVQIDDACDHRRQLKRLRPYLEEAARRHGRTRAAATRAALTDKLLGATDAEAARQHNVPREYVNRAKLWLRQSWPYGEVTARE